MNLIYILSYYAENVIYFVFRAHRVHRDLLFKHQTSGTWKQYAIGFLFVTVIFCVLSLLIIYSIGCFASSNLRTSVFVNQCWERNNFPINRLIFIPFLYLYNILNSLSTDSISSVLYSTRESFIRKLVAISSSFIFFWLIYTAYWESEQQMLMILWELTRLDWFFYEINKNLIGWVVTKFNLFF